MPEWVLTLDCGRSVGVGSLNKNGQLELRTINNMCNTLLRTKPQHMVSWRHPCSKHWHQLDLIRWCHLKNVLLTRSFQSTDCDTDHSLVCCSIRMKLKKLHHARSPGKVCISINTNTKHPDKVEEFTEALEKAYTPKQPEGNAQQRWIYLRDTLHSIALAIA